MRLSSKRRNIELHLHWDGALRPSTLFEEAKRRGIKLPYATSKQMEEELILRDPCSLPKMLENFAIFLPILTGDKETLSRCARDFVEDCAEKASMAYVEARFAPHLLTSNDLDAEAVTVTVLDAMKRASEEYSVGVGLILCNMVGKPEIADDIFQLALKYKSHGVVGIDLAGNESLWADGSLQPEVVKCFEDAKAYGIHRTVHAGESGTWRNVKYAVETLHAERIGHGYHMLDNEELYANLLNANMHFEMCPTSSILTGAEPLGPTHAVCRLAGDGANYSVNTDDPMLTGRWLMEEQQFCLGDPIRWPKEELRRTRINAAKAAFIDDQVERDRLVQHVSGSGDDDAIHKLADRVDYHFNMLC